MSSALPRWRETTLGQLGCYLNGRAFKKHEWGSQGRPIIRIQNLTGSSAAYNYFHGEVEDRYIVRRGDLLVSWAATLGAYIWTGPEAVLNQHIFKVASNIDVRFHKYLLDHKLSELMRHTHGSGMVHITRRRFDSLPVLVPPLDEQRRIVNLLEDHLSRLDAADAGIAAADRRAQSMVEASLASTVAGVASTARASTVGAEALFVEYGSGAKCGAPDKPDDIPVLRMGNIRNGAIAWEDLKYLPAIHADFPKLLLKPGDLLFNRTNSAELVGKSAVFDSHESTSFASYLIRVRFKDEVDSRWANIAINGPQGRAYVASVVSQQVGQANVNGTKLKAFPLPVPSLAEQHEAIVKHQSMVEAALRLRASSAVARQRARFLRQALLGAAFSGRLTVTSSDLDRAEDMAGG